MKHLISLSLIFSSLLLLLTWAKVSDARPFRLEKLPDKGTNWRCATCHINPAGAGPRNAFGQDYEAIGLAAGDVYTAELGQKDSDGDGFANDDEFNANPPTEPWNPDSHPVATAVKPQGKRLMTWARLKSMPFRLRLNLHSTTKASVPALTEALKGKHYSVRGRDAKVSKRIHPAATVVPARIKTPENKNANIRRSAAKSPK